MIYKIVLRVKKNLSLVFLGSQALQDVKICRKKRVRSKVKKDLFRYVFLCKIQKLFIKINCDFMNYFHFCFEVMFVLKKAVQFLGVEFGYLCRDLAGCVVRRACSRVMARR